ncbi:MAG TPA: hypothetical protein VHE13_15385, partial [Opitutus sp.]|nr:hypothetical protein [Opitutus sp.]
EVTQPRFARIDSRFEVRFQIAPALVRDGRVSIWFNQGFLQSFALDSVSPEPEREEIDDFRTIFRFAAAAAPRQPVTIRFQFRTTRMGPGRGHAGVLDGPAVPLAHLIYP